MFMVTVPKTVQHFISHLSKFALSMQLMKLLSPHGARYDSVMVVNAHLSVT